MVVVEIWQVIVIGHRRTLRDGPLFGLAPARQRVVSAGQTALNCNEPGVRLRKPRANNPPARVFPARAGQG
jgi:hypothetical protein